MRDVNILDTETWVYCVTFYYCFKTRRCNNCSVTFKCSCRQKMWWCLLNIYRNIQFLEDASIKIFMIVTTIVGSWSLNLARFLTVLFWFLSTQELIWYSGYAAGRLIVELYFDSREGHETFILKIQIFWQVALSQAV